MPTSTTHREWRGWIWVAVSVTVSLLAGGFSLHGHALRYTDQRVTETQHSLVRQLDHLREDIRILHGDIKQVLRER